MISSMSSSVQKHRDSKNTVAVQAGVQRGQDGRRQQGVDKRDAGGTEQSQFQPSVRSVTIALEIFTDLASLCRDKMTPMSVHLNDHAF